MRRALTSTSTTKSALAGLGLISILLLGSGCAMETGVGSSSNGGSSSGSESESSDSEAGGDNADSPLAAAEACFPGAWTLDVESYQELMDNTEGQLVENASGVITLTFEADGSVTTVYDDWYFDSTIDFSKMSSVRNGTDTGTYEISAEGTATITDTNVDSEDEVTMTMGANSQTVTENPGGSMFRSAPLSCEGDEITAAVHEDGGVTLNRVS